MIFDSVISTVKTVASTFFASGQGPINLDPTQRLHMVKQPQTVVNRIMDTLNRLIRPGLALLVIWMFFWFYRDPDDAKLWIAIVKDIPDQMWNIFFTLLISIGVTKAIRDAKAPHGGGQLVVLSDVDGSGDDPQVIDPNAAPVAPTAPAAPAAPDAPQAPAAPAAPGEPVVVQAPAPAPDNSAPLPNTAATNPTLAAWKAAQGTPNGT